MIIFWYGIFIHVWIQDTHLFFYWNLHQRISGFWVLINSYCKDYNLWWKIVRRLDKCCWTCTSLSKHSQTEMNHFCQCCHENWLIIKECIDHFTLALFDIYKLLILKIASALLLFWVQKLSNWVQDPAKLFWETQYGIRIVHI